MTFKYVYKYIIIGDVGVGKSCLLLRFTNDEYKMAHFPTLGLEFISQVVHIDNELVK
jgi:Ras-related protein Rab-2A